MITLKFDEKFLANPEMGLGPKVLYGYLKYVNKDASNNELANTFGVSNQTICNWRKSISELPIVSIDRVRESKSIVKSFSEETYFLCNLLADLIEKNGSKRPVVTNSWLIEADRMQRLDGRSVEQIRRAIEWCQHDHFWRANILSMPKLREKYDQLRLKASVQSGAISEYAQRKKLL